jgi:hypothetical protein
MCSHCGREENSVVLVVEKETISGTGGGDGNARFLRLNQFCYAVQAGLLIWMAHRLDTIHQYSVK